MKNNRRLFTLLAAGAVVIALVVSLVVANSGKGSGGGGTSSNSTITLAEAPATTPTYIFPFMACPVFSVANISAFDYEMYRPLYWFGWKNTASEVPSLSLANQPVMSNANKTVTVTMKGWKFADGQTVNAQSVMFFLNMFKANPSGYCGYNKGYGIPDQVASAKGSGNTLTLTFTRPMNPYWLLYNNLSLLTPMPDSWDITAPGKKSTCASGAYGAAATNQACMAVYKYLDGQSKKVATATNAMWQSGDDGPWKLTQFDNLGDVTFVPNTKYSGPQKAQVAMVKEIPYASASAEQTALRSGSITIGYVDNGVLTSNGTPDKPGANWSPIASKYNLEVGPPWSVNYAALNLDPKSKQAVFLQQLYIRQALQMTVNQTGMIDKIQKGYGYPQINPLPPVTPANIKGNASDVNPYPYDPAKASALLKSHGWVLTGGTLTCSRVGTATNQCGAGITNGQKLALSMLYATGTPVTNLEVNTEVSEWKSIGIAMTTSSATFNSVIGTCNANSGAWSICWWGAGWIYAPGIYPSGEVLFVPGGGFNPGAFSNAQLTASVQQTDFGTANLGNFANIAAKVLPDLYEPNGTNSFVANGIGEVSKSLKASVIGLAPNPLTNFMPEYYHF
jgi:peptide/nickel transport system substrate-binding protein